jgi:hypothetical protein
MRRHPAVRFGVLVLVYAVIIVVVNLVLRGRVSHDVGEYASGAVGSAAATTIWLVVLHLRSVRSNAPTETVLLDGTDDELMRRATTVLHACGIAGVNVDRPARTVRGRRVTVAVEPDEENPGRCRVTVRAAPLLASRRTDWGPYRALAAAVARELAEFRTTTAETR